MKILVLGATGRTGKLVLKTALEKGYQVHCLSRNSQRIERPRKARRTSDKIQIKLDYSSAHRPFQFQAGRKDPGDL